MLSKVLVRINIYNFASKTISLYTLPMVYIWVQYKILPHFFTHFVSCFLYYKSKPRDKIIPWPKPTKTWWTSEASRNFYKNMKNKIKFYYYHGLLSSPQSRKALRRMPQSPRSYYGTVRELNFVDTFLYLKICWSTNINFEESICSTIILDIFAWLEIFRFLRKCVYFSLRNCRRNTKWTKWSASLYTFSVTFLKTFRSKKFGQTSTGFKNQYVLSVYQCVIRTITLSKAKQDSQKSWMFRRNQYGWSWNFPKLNNSITIEINHLFSILNLTVLKNIEKI